MAMEPGFYQMAASEYHSDPAPSPSLTHSTAMTILDRNPFVAWYYHPRLGGHERPSSREMDNGTIAHLLLTGQGRQAGIIDEDNYRKASTRVERDAIKLRGLTPVLRKDYIIAEDMVRTARQTLATMGTGQYAFDAKFGHCELVAVNLDVAGVWTRTMIDFYGAKMPTGIECWDYKTTSGSANPVMLKAHMSRMGWAMQAAMQERIIVQLKPELAGRIKFRFLCQENEPPFLCSVVAPSASMMIVAHKMIAAAVAIWKQCLNTDAWPTYPTTPIELAVLPWIEAAWLNRELEDELVMLAATDPWLGSFEGWNGQQAPPPVLSELPVPATAREQPTESQRAIKDEQPRSDQRAPCAEEPKTEEHATQKEQPQVNQRARKDEQPPVIQRPRLKRASTIEKPTTPKRRPGRPRKAPAAPPPEDDDQLLYEPPPPKRVDV